MKKYLLILLFLICAVPVAVSAHSGRTDSNGCHTNKKTGDYHCHNAVVAVDVKPARAEARTEARTDAKTEQKQAVDATTTPTQASPVSAPIATPVITSATPLYDVVSVTDGDTIKVNIGGTTETIRLIGIDTPETVDPRKPVQCFGQEASKKSKELLTGKKVRLEADPTQGERDKYGRLLRFVFLEDGTNFNKMMIAEGYAHEYTYDSNPYKYQVEFKDAEKQAREANKGLWSPTSCSGDTSQGATSSTTANQSTSKSPAVTATTPITSTPILSAPGSSSPPVKKSTSSICHAQGTTYYNQTTNFTPYNTIDECLASGGRLPKK